MDGVLNEKENAFREDWVISQEEFDLKRLVLGSVCWLMGIISTRMVHGLFHHIVELNYKQKYATLISKLR